MKGKLAMSRFLLTTFTILLSLGSANADEFQPVLKNYLTEIAASWANDPVLIEAINAANLVTNGYSSDQIIAMDQAWREEVGAQSQPTITPVLNNAAAEFLSQVVQDSGGIISEAFIMDGVGLNVAASATTSDMWQGDETKFTATYTVGPGATHIAEVELDESTQTYLGQVSMTISDPATGLPIGALTVGLNAEAIF